MSPAYLEQLGEGGGVKNMFIRFYFPVGLTSHMFALPPEIWNGVMDMPPPLLGDLRAENMFNRLYSVEILLS